MHFAWRMDISPREPIVPVALTAESAQQRVDEVGRTADHERLGIACAHPAAMPDDLRRRSGQGTRQLCDDICRDVALAFGPLRRIGTHKVRQRFEILNITLHVRGIVEFFSDQDMQHCQVESQIRAGTDLASILWKDSRRSDEACEVMQLTPASLLKNDVIEGIIPEHRSHRQTIAEIAKVLDERLQKLEKLTPEQLLSKRNSRFRKF